MDYLDRERVHYVKIPHSPTYTARETAQSAHVLPKDFAKTVIVSIDGRLAMAVLPATQQLALDKLKKATGAKHVRLAPESEFERWFPGCEPGAMPPFGNLYGMEVFAATSLAADEQIAFNAGSHAELIMMGYRDFDRLVHPILALLSTTVSHVANTPQRV